MVEGNSKEEEEVEEPEDFCLGTLVLDMVISLRPDPRRRLYALYEAAIIIKTTTECKEVGCGSEEAEEVVEAANDLYVQFGQAMQISSPDPSGGPNDPSFAAAVVTRAAALGCCDYPCAKRIKIQNESLTGSIPSRSAALRRPGKQVKFYGLDFQPVVDRVLSEFGFGGNYPPTFRPCCKKKKAAEAGTPGAI